MDVVVNEVMANVKGSETTYGQYNEFVELLNVSGQPVDLSGWSISDGDAVDLIVPWAESLGALRGDPVLDTYIVSGGAYCVILDRDYAGAPDSAGYRPYDFPPGTVVFTTANSTIGNGLSVTDPVTLLDEEGDTADTYGTPTDSYDSLPFDPGDGISAERVFPTSGDEDSNWAACASQGGSTPGFENSVTPYTGVGLSWEDIYLSPSEPEPGGTLEIEATVHNRSLHPVSGVRVTFYVDSDGDARPDGGEEIETMVVDEIGPLDGEVKLEAIWSPVPAGCHRIGVQVLDTVRALRTTRAGRGPGFVVINEIMYDPETSGEWVELHNWSEHELNLGGWTLSDPGRSCVISEKDLKLSPGAFALGCEDTSALLATFMVPDAILIQPAGFPSLNNPGDSLTLSDAAGFIMDRLYYMEEWGGGDGVSIERVSPTCFSYERSNWGGCVDARGATPGRDNSIHAPVRSAEMTMRLAPNPFSPDGDGHQDFTGISYELPFAVARLRVIVYDRRGRLVREILPGNQVASSGALLWDGRDDRGRPLPLGVYLVYLEACDLMTQARICSKSTAVLAKRMD